MKEHIVLFLTHFDDYLDTCLELRGGSDGFDSIRKMKRELKSNSLGISNEEYHKKEANIFYEYLKLVGAVS
jgi:hypothetical protein